MLSKEKLRFMILVNSRYQGNMNDQYPFFLEALHEDNFLLIVHRPLYETKVADFYYD